MSGASSAIAAVLLVLSLGLVSAERAFHGLDPWGESLTPKYRVNYLSQKSATVRSFLGNQTHHDHFKLLQSDGESLLIGARNVIYNLSLADLSENKDHRITWTSPERDRELCLVKGKKEDECQNYIRVLAQTSPSSLLVCGTNSFNPKCRIYSSLKPVRPTKDKKAKEQEVAQDDSGSDFKVQHEFSGKGSCPYDPKHNSTAIFTDGELYSGTVADFSGSDALILKDRIRTEKFDLKQLNAPDFVGSMEDSEHVYFFFREAAVEYINCGKSVYSRVARVCKGDQGGSHKHENKWTTFLKTRLNCSVPGDMPFYFNEIQSVSQMIDLPDGDKLVYGVFTTPDNAIAGSAVCSFKLSDMAKAFDQGPFKGQRESDSNWLPLGDGRLPDGPRPGSCSADSKKLSERNLNFIRENSLMDTAVGSNNNNPLFVRTSLKERLTVVAVDPQVRAPGSDAHSEGRDVIFVGTTRGRVLKFVAAENPTDKKDRKPVLIEEIQVFPYHVAVSNMQVVRIKSTGEARLIVLSDYEVKTMPLNRCYSYQVENCGACVALQDPYCAWNVQTNRCVDHREAVMAGADESALVQDIFTGQHAACSQEGRIFAARINSPSDSNSVEDYSDDADTEDMEDESLEESELLVQRQQKHLSEAKRQEEIDIVIQEDQYLEKSYIEGLPIQVSQASAYSGETLTWVSLLVAFFSLFVGFAIGFITSRRFPKDSYNSCGHHYLETQLNKQNETGPSHTSESGYTMSPCNNHTQQLLSGANPSSNSLTNATANGDEPLKKNSNLLVNVPTKDDLVEKNAITGVSTRAVPAASNTGTIGRTGTLCKKVYL